DISSASDERGSGTMGGRLRRDTLLKGLGAGALLPLLYAGAAERAEAAGQTYSFYLVSHNGPGNAFMEAESKGVAAAGRDLGVKTTFIGPKPGNETEQISMLRSAIAASPDGIAFSLYSPGPSTALIKDAQSK